MSKIHEHEFININGVMFQRTAMEPTEDIPRYDIPHYSTQELEEIYNKADCEAKHMLQKHIK